MKTGFTAEEIERVKKMSAKNGQPFEVIDLASETKDWCNFRFVGKYQGKEIVFDAFFYTLEMEFFTNVFEDAQKEVVKLYPQYTGADFDLEDGKHIELMDEYAESFVQDSDYEVQEFIQFDEDNDYSVSIDICLNLPEINEQEIARFVEKFNADQLKLDKTYYSFDFE